MARETAKNYEDVVQNVRAFDAGMKEEKEGLEGNLSYFRAWYYIPELDAVGPSKFIGYKNMTAAEYMRDRGELDGRVTEPVLRQWFNGLAGDSPEADYVKKKVEQLCRYGHMSRLARFNAPDRWKLDKTGLAVSSSVRQAEDSRPIIDVFWRAFLSLSPKDQDALAARIIQHKQ